MKFYCLIPLLALILCVGSGANAGRNDANRPPKIRAKLCNDCGFGSKKDNCVKCGKWVGNANIPARFCDNCGFGSKKDNCVKCGKWVGSANIDAKLCNNCGFGSKKENCVKCGRWAP